MEEELTRVKYQQIITCSEISVSGLENFAQPVQPLFEVAHILGGVQHDRTRLKRALGLMKVTWVSAMISSCSTRWDSALPSELTLHTKNDDGQRK